MNNPNSPTYDETNSPTPELMRSVAAKLKRFQDNPPTLFSVLSTWPGLPLLLIAGAFGTALLVYFSSQPDSQITSHWPIGVAAMVFGAALRDFAVARRFVSSWTAHQQFIDWKEVDKYTK